MALASFLMVRTCYNNARYSFRTISMDTNVHASLPKSVEVDGFTIYKLKMSEYAQVFEKLKKLPPLIGGLNLDSP